MSNRILDPEEPGHPAGKLRREAGPSGIAVRHEGILVGQLGETLPAGKGLADGLVGGLDLRDLRPDGVDVDRERRDAGAGRAVIAVIGAAPLGDLPGHESRHQIAPGEQDDRHIRRAQVVEEVEVGPRHAPVALDQVQALDLDVEEAAPAALAADELRAEAVELAFHQGGTQRPEPQDAARQPLEIRMVALFAQHLAEGDDVGMRREEVREDGRTGAPVAQQEHAPPLHAAQPVRRGGQPVVVALPAEDRVVERAQAPKSFPHRRVVQHTGHPKNPNPSIDDALSWHYPAG